MKTHKKIPLQVQKKAEEFQNRLDICKKTITTENIPFSKCINLSIKACQHNINEYKQGNTGSSSVSESLDRLEAFISYCCSSDPFSRTKKDKNNNNNEGLVSSYILNNFIIWSGYEAPYIPFEKVEEYIRNHKPEDIVYSYLMSMLRNINSEQAKRLMVLSSGIIPAKESDYEKIFRIQKLHYVYPQEKHSITEVKDVVCRIEGMNPSAIFLDLSDCYVHINAITDRICWNYVLSQSCGELFYDIFGVRRLNIKKSVFGYNGETKEETKETAKRYEKEAGRYLDMSKYNEIKVVNKAQNKPIIMDAPKFW